MKQIGILFQPEMVRANIADRKWMTRRLRKLEQINADPDRWHLWQPKISEETGEWAFSTNAQQGEKGEIVRIKCPYGKAGDTMWQRETHAIVPRTAYAHSDGVIQTLKPDSNHDAAIYRAGWLLSVDITWKPSIHMPRWASRFVRPITRIRCERVQSIDEGDAISEGMMSLSRDEIFQLFPDYAREHEMWQREPQFRPPLGPSPRQRFVAIWKAINGAQSWERNVWCWVVEYAKQESK